MQYRFPVAVLASLASFAAGFASSHLVERSAQAQTAPFASSLYVPADGLAFRTFNGRVIARLSYDRHGGVFDVYDADERPSGRLRVDAGAEHPAARGATRADWGF
jgi:hypothetical protein